jgi:hypothetical protein
MKAFILLFIPLVFIACKKDKDVTGSPELIIIDSVFTTTVDDHGVIYIYPPVSRGSNWKSPYDFYNGSFECRYEIIQYPAQKTFLINLCIWSDVTENWEQYRETCTKQVTINGNGVYTSQSSPSSWWTLDEPVDFSRVNDFYSLGLVLWCDNYLNLSDWSSETESCWDQRNDILPLSIRLTVIAVAKGYTFSGWEEYID